jgi:hypothetical protein
MRKKYKMILFIPLLLIIGYGMDHFITASIRKNKEPQIIEFSPNSEPGTAEENYLSFEENQGEE